MVFSSLIFIWLFLPIVFVLHYFIKPQYANVLLLTASLFFYAWGEPEKVFLMLLSAAVNWIIGIGIAAYKRYGKYILAAGILANLSILCYYKYAGFAVRIINDLAGTEVWKQPETVLPIGISFFTFQAVSYLADIYKGDVEAQRKFVNVALYISFFPQLIAGPIVKYKDINEQIESRTVTAENIAEGFRRFIYGLSKKVLLSNVLGQAADAIYAVDAASISGKMAWCASLCYTFQIYYDFSGYSDMAIGLGKMFGFSIPENFNNPYLSKSVGEFWRRWHISLGAWFREYVYLPLGGNRKGEVRTYLNLAIVFLLTGLWHGADYTFVAWGIYHGFFRIIERLKLSGYLEKRRLLPHCYLFLVVNFGWVIFRADSLKNGLLLWKRMLLPWMYEYASVPIGRYVNGMTVFAFFCAVFASGGGKNRLFEKFRNMSYGSALEFVYCTLLLLLCMASIAGGTYNPFIYFQF